MKIASAFKFETTSDNNKFKGEIRKLESELQSKKPKSKQCQAATAHVKPEKSELGEIKTLLEKMNSRIEVLEKEREQYQINTVQPQQGNDYRVHQQGNEYAGNSGTYAKGMNQGFRLTGNR
ncbi:hypothetical protein DPMN_170020 [Dreissena polymorpha]|uniref:Uncharacterized protein n=1 Tax=Dreissena polymorpha TaxID=45954 RepID=A0A9D4DVM9_DREPO|nr:hypothetical protein DPMN_170020 [Dreissena polymorpha]